MSSSSDDLPNYGLEVDLPETEFDITEPEEPVEVLDVAPLAMIPMEQFEQQQFLDAEMTDDDIMNEDENESDPESETSEEEPSPLCRPPIIEIGAMVYLKVEPLHSYEWKDEAKHGRYLGPVRIVGRLTFMRYRLGNLPGGFVRRFGDVFSYHSLIARRPDITRIIRRNEINFENNFNYSETPAEVLNEFKERNY